MSNDKWFDEHYKTLPSEQPPEFADEAILNAAAKSNSQAQPASARYGWWATAAVVVLSVSVLVNSPEQSNLSAPVESMINSSRELSDVDALLESESFAGDEPVAGAGAGEDDYTNNAALKRDPKKRVQALQDAASGLPQPASPATSVLAESIGHAQEEVAVTATQLPRKDASVADQETKPPEEDQDRRQMEEAIIVTNAHAQPARLEQRKIFSSPQLTAFSKQSNCETYSSTKDEIVVCSIGKNYLLHAPGCTEDLQIAIGELSVKEGGQLIHSSLKEISCSDGQWLVNGKLTGSDP